MYVMWCVFRVTEWIDVRICLQQSRMYSEGRERDKYDYNTISIIDFTSPCRLHDPTTLLKKNSASHLLKIIKFFSGTALSSSKNARILETSIVREYFWSAYFHGFNKLQYIDRRVIYLSKTFPRNYLHPRTPDPFFSLSSARAYTQRRQLCHPLSHALIIHFLFRYNT